MNAFSPLANSHLTLMADAGAEAPSNQEETKLDKATILKRANALGGAEGAGSNSRPGLFITVVEGAKERAIKSDDVPGVFTAFMTGMKKRQGVGYVPMSSEKQQVSKLNCAVKLGELVQVDGMEVVNRVVDAQRKLREASETGKLDMSPFDGLVTVARAQVTASPDTILTPEQIEGLLTKGVSDIPEEADRLEKIMKAAEKLMNDKDNAVSAESAEALGEVSSTLMTRIRELGGSTAMRKEAQKQESKINKATAALVALRA